MKEVLVDEIIIPTKNIRKGVATVGQVAKEEIDKQNTVGNVLEQEKNKKRKSNK